MKTESQFYMSEEEWFQKNYYYDKLEENKLKSIFYFTLVWNIYEKNLCDKDGKINIHPNEHSKKFLDKVNLGLLDAVFEYFKKRYVNNGQKSTHYEMFEFKSEDIKNEVFQFLSKTNPTNEEKLKSLISIAFRLRNNLFHGEKQVEELYEQNENFRMINYLLMDLIEKNKNS